MKGQIEVRPMAAADVDQVLAIADALPGAPHWPRSAYLKAIDPQATPRRIALVVAGTESIVGFAIASVLPPQAELETIAVAKSHQREGLGRQLLHGLMASLKAENLHEVLLEVRHSNHSAIALYMSTGFLLTGSRPSYYTDPVEDAVLMKLFFK